jgi:CubicO group peptidase (beta-lactamase class C family)
MKYLAPTVLLLLLLGVQGCKDEDTEEDTCPKAPSGNFEFSIQSDADSNAVIGSVKEADAVDFSYHITSGNDSGYFKMELNEGKILLADKEALFQSTEEVFNLSVESRLEGCPSGLITVQITADDFPGRVAQELQKIKDKYGIQGIGYSVILPNKAIKTGLLGTRDKDTPLSKEKLWHVTSNTKMVTAALILMLHEEGKLSVNDKLSEFNIAYPNIDDSYTLKQLLGHNTNFANYTESGTPIWGEIYGNPTKVFEIDYLLNKYIGAPTNNPPTGYQYNNTNYAILGRIVEQVTGQDIAAAAKERLFDPLDLQSTSLRTEGMDVKDLNGVYRYFGNDMQNLNGNPVISYLSMWGGAGAMVTTTDELAILVRNILTSKFFKQETIDLALEDSPGSMQSAADWTITYGLGFSKTAYKGQNAHGHGGNGLHKSVSFHDAANGISFTVAYNHMADPDNVKRLELATVIYDLCLEELSK